jgi:hypothetical protein
MFVCDLLLSAAAVSQREAAAALAEDLERERGAMGCYLAACHATLGNQLLGELFLMAYPYIPNLAMIVRIVVGMGGVP